MREQVSPWTGSERLRLFRRPMCPLNEFAQPTLLFSTGKSLPSNQKPPKSAPSSQMLVHLAVDQSTDDQVLVAYRIMAA